MDPDSLGFEIMAHEGCDEMEDEGEKELPDLGLGADCFLENWAALRTRLEGGRLELLAAGCVLPPHLWPAAD